MFKITPILLILIVLLLLLSSCSTQETGQLPATTSTQKAEEFATAIAPLATSTSISLPSKTPPPTISTTEPTAEITEAAPSPTPAGPVFNYQTQFGDSLLALKLRFDVEEKDIYAEQPLPQKGYIEPGIPLIIPDNFEETTPAQKLLPDSEIIFTTSADSFETNDFIKKGGGYLSTYGELISDGWHTGPQVVHRVALNNSVNPRLLITLLEYQSHWVYGKPTTYNQTYYPIKHINEEQELLYKQLAWASQQMAIGYYGWREGKITELDFPDGTSLKIHPELNAGTVALQYLFSRLYNQEEWEKALYSQDSVIVLYEFMFKDPWARAQTVEPFLPSQLEQPVMTLPIEKGHTWNFTGGPHSVWGTDGARGALDFAPTGIRGCGISDEWVTAGLSGLIVRVGNGLVVLDHDQDGNEHTGWVIIYMHIASKDRVTVGTFVDTNDPIGHPSCAGGRSTGTHLHIARRYNGEWMIANDNVPFVLDGWQAFQGPVNYTGTLVNDDLTIEADMFSQAASLITREN